MIPRLSDIQDLNEANAALHQAPRDQTTCAVIARFLGIDSIHFFGRFALVRDVERFLGGDLHAGGELVARDARFQIEFAGVLGEMIAIDRLKKFQLLGLRGALKMLGGVEIQYARLFGADLRALVNRWQPAGSPVLAGELRKPAWIGHRDIRWEIAGL